MENDSQQLRTGRALGRFIVRLALGLGLVGTLSHPTPGAPPSGSLTAPQVIRLVGGTPVVAERIGPRVVVQEGDGVTFQTPQGTSEGASWQWYFNGEPLRAATNATLVIPQIERGDEGAYHAKAQWDTGSSMESSESILLVANLVPELAAGIEVGGSTTQPAILERTGELGPAAGWRFWTNLPAGSQPLWLLDPISRSMRSRFYRIQDRPNLSITAVLTWIHSNSTGTLHEIEYIDLKAGMQEWESLMQVAITESNQRVADLTVHRGPSRQYRTTLVRSAGSPLFGRLAFSIEWTIPEETYARLTPVQKAGLATTGIEFEDARSTVRMHPQRLPGYWVAIGDQWAMSDTNGHFSISPPPGLTRGYVVSEYGAPSTRAEARFTLDQLTPDSADPAPIVIPFRCSGVLAMDDPDPPPPVTRSLPALAGPRVADVICGNPAVSVGNTKSCCLDYDGYVPTTCKGTEDLATAILHYFGSTCHRLVQAGLCAREWNALTISIPPIPGRGPSCFQNHKFRNCQNIDSTLTIAASPTLLRSGETSSIHVHNNTWANESLLTASAGKLVRSRDVRRGSQPRTWMLRHYTASAHLEDLVVTYQAPTLPAGVSQMPVSLEVFGGGRRATLDLLVVHPSVFCDPTQPQPTRLEMSPIDGGPFSSHSVLRLRARLTRTCDGAGVPDMDIWFFVYVNGRWNRVAIGRDADGTSLFPKTDSDGWAEAAFQLGVINIPLNEVRTWPAYARFAPDRASGDPYLATQSSDVPFEVRR